MSAEVRRPSEPAPVPVHLRVSGWRIVVVGAGRVAARKIPPLVDAGAAITVVSPWAHDVILDMQSRALVEYIPRMYAPGDLVNARMALLCTDSPQTQEAAAQEARAANILCYRADQPESSDFHSPAPFNAAGILGSVQTLGVAPLAAAYVRRRIEEFARAELEPAVAAITHIRARVRSLDLPPARRAEILRHAIPAMIEMLDCGATPGAAIAEGEQRVEEFLQTAESRSFIQEQQ